ncbi:sporulation membrane protein YtrI [Neobacillus sp. D3-1R]|uniref:sporulation membrane protein YtrI n=1 Tax=Neobacillus sp. D3-1R TaxID=3445778 RepID=UPI003F9F3B68
MRIPSWQLWKKWRRFFTGMAVGSVISWCIFVFIFGVWQEKHSKLIREQEEAIKEYKSEKLIWQEEFKTLNKKTQEKITIQDVKIKVMNADKYKLDVFSVYEVEESVKEDLKIMIAKDLETVYKSRDLLKKVIEHKVVKINGKRYRLEMKEIYIFTTLHIQLEIHLAT